MDSPSDDDEVVAELPVYVLPDPGAKLYHVQMPLLSSGQKLVPDHVEDSSVSARYKRKQEVLEISVPVEDSKAGLSAADGASGPERRVYTGQASKAASDAVGRYAVGVFKNGALYLSPLAGTIEMRPSFSHLDKKVEDPATGAAAAGDASAESETEATSSGAFRVSFAREVSNPYVKRRKAEMESRKLLQESDPWVEMEYCGEQSTQSDAARNKLAAPAGTSEHLCDNFFELHKLSPKEVLRAACPEPADDTGKTPSGSGLSMRSIMELKLDQQITNLCIKAHALSFDEVSELLHSSAEPDEVTAALEKIATKIGNLWIAKSERVLPKDQCSPRSGVSNEVLALARDFILHKFYNGETFTRKELTDLVYVPDEDLKFILEKVATFNKADRCWKLSSHSFLDSETNINSGSSSTSSSPPASTSTYWQARSAEVQTWLARATAERDANASDGGATSGHGAGARPPLGQGQAGERGGRRRRRSSNAAGSPPRRQRHSSQASQRAAVQPGQKIQLTVVGGNS